MKRNRSFFVAASLVFPLLAGSPCLADSSARRARAAPVIGAIPRPQDVLPPRGASPRLAAPAGAKSFATKLGLPEAAAPVITGETSADSPQAPLGIQAPQAILQARAAGQFGRSGFSGASGETFDGSRRASAHVGYGHGRNHALLRELGLIHSHRKGLFKNRAEKRHAYASAPLAAGVAAFVGYRYMTEDLPRVISSCLSVAGHYFFNDFMTPIGLTAAGYLIALGVALYRYGRTKPDLRTGRRVKAALSILPIAGALGGFVHEMMQSDAFAAAAGFRIAGSFHPGDFLAYAAGGVVSVALAALLWKPYANREGRPIPRFGVAVAFAAAAAFVAPRIIAFVSVDAAVILIAGLCLAAGAVLLATIRSLHESSKL